MKKKTDSQIKTWFKTAVMAVPGNYSAPNIDVRWRGTDSVDVEVEQMYDFVEGINFAFLMKVGEFFSTKDVDVNNNCASSGCNTCGYYSSYETTFNVNNIDSYEWPEEKNNAISSVD